MLKFLVNRVMLVVGVFVDFNSWETHLSLVKGNNTATMREVESWKIARKISEVLP